jgi:pseudouridine-5'-monophosphatase
MPGALRLVAHLEKHKVPIAVASSSHSDQFAVKSAQNMDLFDLFHHITLGNDPELKNVGC